MTMRSFAILEGSERVFDREIERYKAGKIGLDIVKSYAAEYADILAERPIRKSSEYAYIAAYCMKKSLDLFDVNRDFCMRWYHISERYMRRYDKCMGF